MSNNAVRVDPFAIQWDEADIEGQSARALCPSISASSH